MALPDRFWAKVRVTPGCWEWLGATMNGYGVIGVRQPRRTMLAHRVSWELHVGPVPKGLCVLHTCDAPGCTNPAHLFLGTRTDNAYDKVHKGRQSKGVKTGTAKLTEPQVRWIRKVRPYFASGRQHSRIVAPLLGVSETTIYTATNGRSWRHVQS
jgi:hypothetical protein